MLAKDFVCTATEFATRPLKQSGTPSTIGDSGKTRNGNATPKPARRLTFRYSNFTEFLYTPSSGVTPIRGETHDPPIL